MNAFKKTSPWADENGKPYSTEELRIKSKDWDSDTWEDYLSSLETGCHESQISPISLNRLIDEASMAAFQEDQRSGGAVSPSSVGNRSELKAILKKEFLNLSPRQRTVLSLLLFEDKRVCEVAEMLKTSPQNVVQTRDRAIDILRTFVDETGCCRISENLF